MTKLIVEKYLQMFGATTDLNYIILRVANPFGPGQVLHKGQGLIPVVLQRAASKRPVTILGDGLARRDYIYVDDVVDAIIAAIESPCVNRQVLNIGSGVDRSVLEVVAGIERATGLSIQTEHRPPRPTDVKVNVLNSAKAQAILPWRIKTPFPEAIGLTADSFFRSLGKLGQF